MYQYMYEIGYGLIANTKFWEQLFYYMWLKSTI